MICDLHGQRTEAKSLEGTIRAGEGGCGIGQNPGPRRLWTQKHSLGLLLMTPVLKGGFEI